MIDNPDLPSASAALYLDLIERCLTNTVYGDGYTDWRAPDVERPFDASLRELGRDWPRQAHTMIGQRRLRNLRELVETAIREHIPGDLIETGAWRGGACILMRATLAAFGDQERRVYVADSFQGLPPPDPENYPTDLGDRLHTFQELSVSLGEVKANFAKYGAPGRPRRFPRRLVQGHASRRADRAPRRAAARRRHVRVDDGGADRPL